MAFYKVRIEVWCDWNPADSDLDEIVQNTSTGEAICTKQEVVAVVDRPQDIDDDEAMSFFGGEEVTPTKVRGRHFSGASLSCGSHTRRSFCSASGEATPRYHHDGIAKPFSDSSEVCRCRRGEGEEVKRIHALTHWTGRRTSSSNFTSGFRILL